MKPTDYYKDGPFYIRDLPNHTVMIREGRHYEVNIYCKRIGSFVVSRYSGTLRASKTIAREEIKKIVGDVKP